MVDCYLVLASCIVLEVIVIISLISLKVAVGEWLFEGVEDIKGGLLWDEWIVGLILKGEVAVELLGYI